MSRKIRKLRLFRDNCISMKRQTTYLTLGVTIFLVLFSQIFGSHSLRAAWHEKSPFRFYIDSLMLADSSYIADSLEKELDLQLYPIDTMKVPDSLQYTDTFRYRYFIALRDTATLRTTKDSLLVWGDTLECERLDSIWKLDSAEAARWRFDTWYWGLTKKERRAYDKEKRYEQKNAEMLARLEAKEAYEDSVRAIRDSIRDNTPRILETWILPDSLQYKRLIMWELDRRFDDVKLTPQDTSFNYHFPDFRFYREDVNATYLGLSGSPAQNYNFFKREEVENAFFYSPYLTWTYMPENLTMFNTKTPYTELWYSGTLFNGREKEELNAGIRVSQNFTPSLNLTLGIYTLSAKGYLQKEATTNRTAHVGLNYLGKKYVMHAGFIYNHAERNENGGAIDDDDKLNINWIRDTTVDSREIPVRLQSASNAIKRTTVFLDQNYRFPMSFFEKKDSTRKIEVDSLNRDITSAFIGHSSDFSVYSKRYKDRISTTAEKNFYPNNYLNPKVTDDSLRTAVLENKIYLRLQPWKSDAIVSKLDVGIGDKYTNYYLPSSDMYLVGSKNISRNTLYAYAGVKGSYQKYFEWNAFGKYNFAGSEVNDFKIDANLQFNLYPFRRARQSPMSFVFHFETALEEPDYLMQHFYSNHFKWDNQFSKISTTKLTGGLQIPHWDLWLNVGYALLGNYVYFDEHALPRQQGEAFSVFNIDLRKDFTLWKFHFENRLLAQYSTNESVLPLPYLSANLRWYFQFSVVKNVMEMQIGVNAWYTTQWFLPAYNPALGVFHNQFEHRYGDTPIMDAFINIQWKRCCVYIKAENLNMGWPMKSTDYFSAAHYIRPQTCVKVGVFWPFYMSHISNPSVK